MSKDYERVRELRKHLGLSQNEFAQKIGVTRSVIKNIELGSVEMKEYVVKLISSAFNVNEEWLYAGVGEMFAKSKKSILDELVTAHGLNEREKAIVTAFLDLTPDGRAAVIDYIEKASNNLAAVPTRNDIIAGDIAATEKKINSTVKSKK